MPIYNDKKVVQIRIPKTASTSMQVVLRGEKSPARQSGSNRIHSTIAEIKTEMDRSKFDAYFKFSFVRNPFDWFVSNNIYFKGSYNSSRGVSIEEWIFGLGRVMESRGGIYSEYNPYIDYKINNSFTNNKNNNNVVPCGHERCSAIGGSRQCNCLVVNQRDWVLCRDKIAVDFVGKLESLSEDWAFVSNKIGCGVPSVLPHSNKKEHSKSSYLSNFKDERVVEVVYNLFKEDCELFGYDVNDYPGFKS
jgi:hypothetical protein